MATYSTQQIQDAWNKMTQAQRDAYLANSGASEKLQGMGININISPSATNTTTNGNAKVQVPVVSNAGSLGLGAGYNTKTNAPQTQNITTGQTTKQGFTAPSGKYYDLDVSNNGMTSFIGSDGMMKTFNTQKEAQDYISKMNPVGSKVTYSNAQSVYKDKSLGNFQSTNQPPKFEEGMSTEDYLKAYQNYQWNNQSDSLNKNLEKSINSLSFDNDAFKNSIDKNMESQIQKNQQLQQELNNYKQNVDTEFQAIRDKFDENTQKQLDRINQLESTYMENMNQMKNLQADYFKTQSDEINSRIAGEQAGLQGNLSAKGIDQSVINDAIEKARTKHLQQFTTLQQQNLNTLNELNNAYSSFQNDINKQKGTLNDSDLALVQQKFELHKTMADTGTKYNQDMITNTFKPYEDALNEQIAAQSKEMSYEAADKAVSSRYNASTPEDRAQMLQVKLDNITKDAYGKSKLTDIDYALLKRASQMSTYAEALQYLINAGQTISSTGKGSSSAIASAVSSGTLNVGTASTNTGLAEGALAGVVGFGNTTSQKSTMSTNTNTDTSSVGNGNKDKDNGYYLIKGGKVYKQYYGQGVLFPKTLAEAKASGLSIYNMDAKDMVIPGYVSIPSTSAQTGAGSTVSMTAQQKIDFIQQNLTPALKTKYNSLKTLDKDAIKNLFTKDPQAAINALKKL